MAVYSYNPQVTDISRDKKLAVTAGGGADNISRNFVPPSSGLTESHIHNEDWTANFYVTVINSTKLNDVTS
jgi:hypothetical protein